ncbi:MAG: MFS transporter [Candidatus Raymondbacteria bacterium RifOxyA12_full_50_37]|uniref:MFS transporter n=1 Tax=Candidatus Raymondbacteria bacterium RIFOXYD12_FULL_49_13 TaxID=1817890 RepID=A0A1F7F336_UNCRA|nr:MAG: MFS transporter [Candidatus Raymondbacteria bacterium RifOxyA12_full_50_37]OGJ92754.1 MAG: MFS transporter [Candidatus Raymondbacteria bacterium RIFOXYA2_FULL_49_16]OGK00957.1 MAG: MFS transporter [Candidatus Raymondbacteria bacterium RIFOXYD12_FULL_49_13]OGK04167.1 MAG: MFS transporter [Candidatus Raymondbacteria bacterium RifOxyB12_full_50_8]OGK04537.1 MAG: MFS transporter [Candidatus Raymondbacteria bacterium RifOxyC12_full_50_8]OGP44530.1 MAG: MFS transporter [Candidatus Raymondbac
MSNEAMTAEKLPNRWLIAIMGTLLQLCLGTVYAWSFFQKPLIMTYGWTNSQAAWAFSLAICFLGLSAAWGGINLPKYGPKKLAMAGGFLFGLGYLIGALALKMSSLPLLYIGYGVIGGCGLGLGYVTPVATAAKWFPDKKGFITGMVVMGFGLGALLMSKFFAPLLLAAFKNEAFPNGNLVPVFAWLGGIFMVLTMIVGSFLRNPPPGYTVKMPSAPTAPVAAGAKPAVSVDEQSGTFSQYVFSGRFFVMWLIFFCNIAAGISIIGFQSPMLQDLVKISNPGLDVAALAALGGTLIAVSSLFNGLGRFFWGGTSDKIGRVQVFRIMLATQIGAFAILMFTQNPWIFSIVVCYVLLCYGGGFGTMPSFVTTVFGAKMMPMVYGAILTAWSMAGIVGPQVVAIIKDKMGAQAAFYSFGFGGTLLAIGLLLTLAASNKSFSAGK